MPRLTPTEKQDIIRFLEADKPLPDKYRFLLFDDKREVELVWNGKTSEVCNLVLPFQVIEQCFASVESGRSLRPEELPLVTSGYRAEVERMQREMTHVFFQFGHRPSQLLKCGTVG